VPVLSIVEPKFVTPLVVVTGEISTPLKALLTVVASRPVAAIVVSASTPDVLRSLAICVAVFPDANPLLMMLLIRELVAASTTSCPRNTPVVVAPATFPIRLLPVASVTFDPTKLPAPAVRPEVKMSSASPPLIAVEVAAPAAVPIALERLSIGTTSLKFEASVWVCELKGVVSKVLAVAKSEATQFATP
jgi:hypothetical protein